MNKKMIGTLLGTLALGSMTLARAEEGAAPKTDKATKADTKGTKKGDKGDKKKGDKGCSGPKGCGGDKNKLLAELKVLRLLQIRVNQETRDEDVLRAKVANFSADLRDKISTTRDIQGQVQIATDKLHHMTCPDCLSE